MSTSTPPYHQSLRTAEAHLTAVSPVFAGLITRVGSCTLAPNPDVFRVLVGSLIAQFISTAAARSIKDRLETRLKGKVTPRRILNLADDDLKACGISGSKAKAVRGAAEQFARSRRFADELATSDDQEARKLLLPLHGIGPWTVDMLLIFSLSRLDVWPVGDFAVRAGVRDLFGLGEELPKPAEMVKVAESWRPYRSVAAWYLWRSRGFVPQSGMQEGETAANGEPVRPSAAPRKKKG